VFDDDASGAPRGGSASQAVLIRAVCGGWGLRTGLWCLQTSLMLPIIFEHYDGKERNRNCSQGNRFNPNH
jgi:hypothetical protein